MQSLRVIDSHTAGEPTRVVLEGGIPLVGDTMSERREDFRLRHDHWRAGIVREPRGSDVLVGALLTPPVNPGSIAGIIFFNNVGYLGMCGHGTIGVIETLKFLGRIEPGPVSFDTPVGTVTAVLQEDGGVSLRNVKSYRHLACLCVEVDGIGTVHGDVAYGGNWFFLVHWPTFEIGIENASELTDVSIRIREALARDGITGEDGAEIDHVELAGPARAEGANSRNFVLCPGSAYDRSPCGTGTSAKLAALFAAEELEEGATYVQESVAGGVFRGSVEAVEGGVIPTIVGRAHITGENTLYFSPEDPLQWGLE